MSIIFRGTLNPQLQQKTITYSPTSGYNRTWDYKGFSEALMLNLMGQYTGLGCDVTFSGEHGVFTLKVRDSTGEVTLDTWQIQQSDERPSCLDNPINIANTTASERKIIKRALSGNITPTEAIAALNTGEGVSTYTALGTYAARMYNRMNDGGTEFVRSIYIVRHTTNANSSYQSNIADTDVDCIYTNAGLLAECQNTSYWLLPMPPAIVYTIQNNLVFPPVRSFYLNGWLKRGPSRSTAANFRIEITTEYWMGQWSSDEYYVV